MIKTRRRFPRALAIVLTVVVALVFAAVLAAYLLFRGSLPQLNGEVRLTGMSAPATIERDAQGTLTIRAVNALDASRALGYVHAQERYFHMDTFRRLSAGELSELVSADLVGLDEAKRLHRIRERIDADPASFVGEYGPELEAYVAGVNAGLADLRVRPWPYFLLGKKPEPWTVTDSALAGFALFFDLQEGQLANELRRWKVKQEVPPALFEFITHESTDWDAPLLGDAWGYAELPSAAEIDMRTLPAVHPAVTELPLEMLPVGSNNFAVSGDLTADGRAILASDMHLGLAVPNIWQRVHLVYNDPRAPGGVVDVHGVTLPGLPAVVAGNNGRVTWAFTNAYADTADLKYYDPQCTANPDCFAVTTYDEVISTPGGSSSYVVEETDWGPILHRTEDGGAVALRWVAHLPGAMSLNLMSFVLAQDIDELFGFADTASVPIQNMVAADSAGRIAWRILGALPDRAPGCGLTDVDLAYDAQEGCEPWPISTAIAPRLVDPGSGRLWTANSRVMGDEDFARFGSGAYSLGVRAWQIRDLLMVQDSFTERDLLNIQLDDRALLLEGWWQLFRSVVTGSSDPVVQGIEATTRTWEGHATINAVSYRAVRDFRTEMYALLQRGLLAPFTNGTLAEGLGSGINAYEGWLWPLVTEQPMHLLPAAFGSWDELFEYAVKASLERVEESGRDPYTSTWGQANVAAVCHQFALFVPDWLGRYLCMPPDQLGGDNDVPRVARPDFGASQRTIVSPGREELGIMHLPGGQSGHPLSPYWGAGNEDWVNGVASPYLPGQTVYTLTVRP